MESVSLADDPRVREAIEAARTAGVPGEAIERECRLAGEGPQDDLTPIVLVSRLARLARMQAETGSRGGRRGNSP